MIQALVSLFRRAASPRAEPGQAEGIALLAGGKWTLELLKHLEWRRLEELCAAYFADAGFSIQILHERADGSAQICLIAPGASEASIHVHCKPWDAYPIGLKALRELRSTATAANGPEVVLVTSGRFTPEAKAYAAKERIELVDGAALLGKLNDLSPEKGSALLKLVTKGDFLTPTCPRCFIKMTARRSTGHGRQFWGCRNYPRCKLTFAGSSLVRS
jgi:restriction system protein